MDPSRPVATVCPECGGVLSERSEASAAQWECRVGHRYSPSSLLDAQAGDVEAALWAAVRALEDRRILLDRMAHQLEVRGQLRSARSVRRRASHSGDQATVVHSELVRAAASSLLELEHGRLFEEAEPVPAAEHEASGDPSA